MLSFYFQLNVLSFYVQLNIAQSELDIYLSNQQSETSKLKEMQKNQHKAESTLKDRKRWLSLISCSVLSIPGWQFNPWWTIWGPWSYMNALLTVFFPTVRLLTWWRISQRWRSFYKKPSLTWRRRWTVIPSSQNR